MTTIAIVQSCYIPWKGYFDLIRRADVFVLFDCVQYTGRDWRNRNRIKTPNGPLWLTIPVQHESREQRICDTRTLNGEWKREHWESLRHAYGKAVFFGEYGEQVQALYENCGSDLLSEVNLHFLAGINAMLGIATPLHLLRDHIRSSGDRTDRLLDVCRHFSATRYISGPSAQDYLDTAKFAAAGVDVEWMDYGHYPEYAQLYPPFQHDVSILDALFNAGGAAGRLF